MEQMLSTLRAMQEGGSDQLTPQLMDEMKEQFMRNMNQNDVQIEPEGAHRQTTMATYEGMYAQVQKVEAEKLFNLNMTMNTDPVSCGHVCTQSISELESIVISDLRVNHVHLGTKLEATIIAKPAQMVGTTMVIEDGFKNIILLSVYNHFPANTKLVKLAKEWPVGSRIVILEPYCKKAMGGAVVLRIDNPHANLVFIDPSKAIFAPKLAGAETLKLSVSVKVRVVNKR